MLLKLERESAKIGLSINLSKTKTMCHEVIKITFKNKYIENMNSYLYLGHKITLGRGNETIEINRRKRLAWASFGKLSSTLKNKNLLLLLSCPFSQCIKPVLTYGAETWMADIV